MMGDDKCGVLCEILAGETEAFAENLPLFYFVHHKFHIALHGLEIWPPWWEDIYSLPNLWHVSALWTR
jgi:hypothetical protein